MRKLLIFLTFSIAAFAQAPPQIPLTGNIGVQGSVAILGGTTVQMPSDADYTLTPAQWSNKTLIVTSATSLTQTRNLIAPLNKGQEFNVENVTTGGQSLQIIGATGTGVTIANGASVAVFSDGTNYIQMGAASISPVPGALAEYPMSIGTGTIVRDISGNGNNATLASGANAPSWYTYGLAFMDTGAFDQANPQFATTPLTTWRTLYVAHCSPFMVQNSGIVNYTYSGGWPLFTGVNSSTTGGVDIGIRDQTTAISVQPSIIDHAGTSVLTSTVGAYGGCHVYGYALDTTADHITVDGVEVANYGSHHSGSASKAPVSGGTYLIGAGDVGGITSSIRGVITYMMYYPTEHTIAQMMQATRYIQQQLALRPTFPHYPTLTNSVASQLVLVGDSLTAGYSGTSQWSASLVTNNPYVVSNWGIQSLTAIDACTVTDNRWVQSIVPGQSIVHIWVGTNDVALARSIPDIWAAIGRCVVKAKQYGARTIVSTMISRLGSDTGKNTLNALIRNNYKKIGVDYLNDLAEVPTLGADGASASGACFSDHTHLTGPGAGTCGIIGSTNLSGYGIVGALVQGAVNTMDGSSPSNPDVTTSNTFAAQYANNYVIQTPSAAATYSLVDCQGQTSIRTLVNGSATNSITVSAINSQAITGSATVSPNTTAQFLPVLIGPTTGGCYWLRVQ